MVSQTARAQKGDEEESRKEGSAEQNPHHSVFAERLLLGNVIAAEQDSGQ